MVIILDEIRDRRIEFRDYVERLVLEGGKARISGGPFDGCPIDPDTEED